MNIKTINYEEYYFINFSFEKTRWICLVRIGENKRLCFWNEKEGAEVFPEVDLMRSVMQIKPGRTGHVNLISGLGEFEKLGWVLWYGIPQPLSDFFVNHLKELIE